jgi:hypothetical protein
VGARLVGVVAEPADPARGPGGLNRDRHGWKVAPAAADCQAAAERRALAFEAMRLGAQW